LEDFIVELKSNIAGVDQSVKLLKELYQSKKDSYSRWQERSQMNRRSSNLGLSSNNNNSTMWGSSAKLPKFRQEGEYNEPGDFLEAYRRVMEAHDISLNRYARILPLCLDTVDCLWH